MINITGLKQDIQTQINSLAGSESVEDVLLLTTAMENITDERYITVETYSELPNLTTTSVLPGTVVFVKQFNVMMIATDTEWKGMDGRTKLPPVIAYAWGTNTNGRLGDNTTSNRSSPVTVVGGITDWSKIASGDGHTVALTNLGILYSWGRNSSFGAGALGDNTSIDRSSPVTVVGGIINWIDIDAGDGHCLGLRANGVLYAWGTNGSGQLGDNTTVGKSSPVTVVGGITTWSQIKAGQYHNLGLTTTGTAYAWGEGFYGRTGLNTQLDRSSPNVIVGGITTWNNLATKGSTSLGTTVAGILYGWGRNSTGSIGDNTTSNRSSPVTVVGGITTWSKLAAGFTSLGLTTAGILYAWGQNSSGEIGDNTTSGRSSPVTVVGGITTWSQITSGGSVRFGLVNTGIIYGWGSGSGGRLGDGSTSNKSSPVTIAGGITTWTQVSSGQNGHTIAIAT
jgi:alpha-tubulin suppressor-like RCC1 family protein